MGEREHRHSLAGKGWNDFVVPRCCGTFPLLEIVNDQTPRVGGVAHVGLVGLPLLFVGGCPHLTGLGVVISVGVVVVVVLAVGFVVVRWLLLVQRRGSHVHLFCG